MVSPCVSGSVRAWIASASIAGAASADGGLSRSAAATAPRVTFSVRYRANRLRALRRLSSSAGSGAVQPPELRGREATRKPDCSGDEGSPHAAVEVRTGLWRVHRSRPSDRRRNRSSFSGGPLRARPKAIRGRCRRHLSWTDGWQLGRPEPDRVVSGAVPSCPADGPDFSRIFVLRLPVTTRRLRERIRVPAGQRRRRASCQHPDRCDAALAGTRRTGPGARLQRSAAVVRRLSGRSFPRVDARPGGAAPAEGARLAAESRDRSRRRDALRPERTTAGGSAGGRSVLHGRTAGTNAGDAQAGAPETSRSRPATRITSARIPSCCRWTSKCRPSSRTRTTARAK